MGKKTKASTVIKIIASLLILCGTYVLCIVYFFGAYKELCKEAEIISNCWTQVDSSYQQRFDKIPHIVSTAKDFAKNESEFLSQVTEARAKCEEVTQLNENFLANQKAFAQYQEAQDALSSSLQSLLAIAEKNPGLKSNQKFLVLQDEIAEMENQISVEKENYNVAVLQYNKDIRVFPKSIIATNHGFWKKPCFNTTVATEATH